jgi:DNA-binding NarL/FixJ family response regulator
MDSRTVSSMMAGMLGNRAAATMIRIVLADDHAVVRQGIRDFLEDEADMQVVAEASDGAAAKVLIEQHLPDVAILDVRMPHASGIDVAAWVQDKGLPVRILMLTSYDDEPYVVAAVQAGASGYVLKDAQAPQIVAAVRTVAAGQLAMGREIAHKLMAHLSSAAQGEEVLEPLTERELEVLAMVASGATNRAIGRALHISERTVQGHIANIFGKLQVASRTEAVTKGLQLGLIKLPGAPA